MPGYLVTIGDAFQLASRGQSAEAGRFGTAAEAIATAKEFVETSLKQLYRPGMTADELLEDYFALGRDPFVISPANAAPVVFSAWDHAAARAAILCKESQNDLLSR